MSRVSFLIATDVAEAGLGLALLVLPTAPLALLLGIATPAADTLFIARIAGAAILASRRIRRRITSLGGSPPPIPRRPFRRRRRG